MNIGIIGTGRIASRFVDTALQGVESSSVYCVYNPRIESAEKFAVKHSIPVYTSDLDIFLENVDAVYIASPHETHYMYSRRALEAGKHVLCEKPMALKKSDVKELIELAKKNGLVCMEALKTKYCPGYKALINAAKSGKIGRIVDVEAAFSRLTKLNTREYMNDIYNGSFLEFGSYGLLPVFELMGCTYDNVSFMCVRAQNGVDAYTKAFIDYNDKTAIVKTGLGAKTEGQLLITGTNGYILAKSPWWLTKEFEIRYEDPNKIEKYRYAYEGSGLQYELREFLVKIESYSKISSQIDDTSDYISTAMADVMERWMAWNRPIYDTKQALFMKQGDRKPLPAVWAHRGCCTLYPENTMEAFRAAAVLPGIAGIELDIQLTSDGEIIVFHDENLKRVTGIDKEVCKCTFDEIKSIDIQANDGKTCKIPALEEVLAMMKPYCKDKGQRINIELKTSVVRYAGIEKKAMELVKKHDMESHIVWSSFLAESVSIIKQLDSNAKTGVLAVSLEECITMARQTGAEALHPYIGGLVYELPEDMKDMPVRAWNVDEPFFNDGRELKEAALDGYKYFGATDIFTNLPQNYLN